MALTATAEGVGVRLSLNGLAYCVARVEDHSGFKYVDPNAELMCGSYDWYSERVAIGPRIVRLHVLLYPTPERWDTLLPLIGYTETADVFTPKNTLTEFSAQVDYDGTDTGNYLNGVVAMAIIRGQQGLTPVSCELQMVFQDYNLTASWAGTAETLNAPYEFTAGSMTMDPTTASTSRDFNSFVFVHNNNVMSRFNNSVTADNLAMTQRVVNFGVNQPFRSTEQELLADAVVDADRLIGQAASLTFTRGAQSLQLDMPRLKTESAIPSVLKKTDEIRLMQFFQAYRDTDDEVATFTNTLS